MNTIQIQREIQNDQEALRIADDALNSEFKTFYKLWLIKAQIQEELGLIEEARNTYESALKSESVKKETKMWLLAA